VRNNTCTGITKLADTFIVSLPSHIELNWTC